MRSGWILVGVGMLLTLGCRAGGAPAVGAAARAPVSSPDPLGVSQVSPRTDRSLTAATSGDKIEQAAASSDQSEVRLVSGNGAEAASVDPSLSPSTGPAAISLTSAVALALAQNPDLVAQRQAEYVGSAALGVAQTYPFNPFVQVQATPYQDQPTGGQGTTYHYVLLMQTIQLAHQQQYREEGASATLNTVRWNIHQAELLNVAQTERLYFSALYQLGLRDLARESDANNQQLLGTLEKQLAAGQATAADVAIVRIDARSTRQQMRLAEANYQTALRDLRRQLNLPPKSPEEPVGKLSELAWRPANLDTLGAFVTANDAYTQGTDPKGLVVGFASARPDVLAARSDVDMARAGSSLATAARTPDLQIGPYYQRTVDGTTFLGFRAQMDLPVVNNGVPLENQRNCELHQRVATWQQLQIRAGLEAEAALERYELAYQTVAEERETQHTSLPAELRRLEEQFKAGDIDVIRVVQARTSMIQNQRVYLDLQNELAQAAANLTAATGIAPEALLGNAPASD
ncbi:MAG: cusC 1 [Planctomycetaceae bacterium]|nr:cusC 1 [Planctomycetaceae bacterium]